MREKRLTPLLVDLNRELPFIKAVYNFIQDPSQIDIAAYCLKTHEAKYGIEVLSSFGKHKFWNNETGGYSHISREVSYAEIISMLTSEDSAAFAALFTQKPNIYEEFRTKLYPFLSATEFLIEGSSLQDSFFFRLSNGTIMTDWSHRGWGDELANWANSVGWHNAWRLARGEPWDYTDFFCNRRSFINFPGEWDVALHEIIDWKCSREIGIR